MRFKHHLECTINDLAKPHRCRDRAILEIVFTKTINLAVQTLQTGQNEGFERNAHARGDLSLSNANEDFIYVLGLCKLLYGIGVRATDETKFLCSGLK